MLNVTHTLEKMEISLESPTRAIQAVRDIVTATENVAINTRKFIKSLLSMDVNIEDNDEARVIALAVIEQVVLCKGEIGDEVVLYEKAVARAHKHMKANSWMYAKADQKAEQASTTSAIEDGISVQVKDNGKIKRGGKAVVAEQLFKKYVIDSTTPCDNACFVKILVEKAQFTIAGARTYAHNLRKAAGMVNK